MACQAVLWPVSGRVVFTYPAIFDNRSADAGANGRGDRGPGEPEAKPVDQGRLPD